MSVRDPAWEWGRPTYENAATEDSLLNKRELALRNMIQDKGGDASTYLASVSNDSLVVPTEGRTSKISRSEDNEAADLQYRRSFLYTL